ncbi:NAD(P)-binding protein [Amniculicola lignicola CBS 123094]|uniref:NAD(P)-binding protein n=1 Tax=Amniculicola lignicola CBS 123094 TaxID=1392246 RepID=A0A6A5WEB5_9PLEO|nr:NAD(P)-binding protein [Amniculicola lignicola CBS 123094]
MLILIAGITGNIGQHAARYAISTGHQVRGLGRNPDKLDKSIRSGLESFITSKTYYDIPALDAACANVDAIICAYSGTPEMHLDAQLLLLRAAERSGVNRFLAAGWNYDWRKIQFGIDEPIYDAIMSFHRHVALSSRIKPCHIFSGMLAEVFFGTNGQDGFTPKDDGVWDAHKPAGDKSMDIWGTGDEKWNFATEEDAGKLGIEVITKEGAEKGGFVSVCSWTCSLNELRETYEKVRGSEVQVNRKGTVEELEKWAVKQREVMGPNRMWEWHRFWFHLFCVKGTWNLEGLQNEEYPTFNPATLVQFLREHPEV